MTNSLKCFLNEVIALAAGRYRFKLSIAADVQPPARCALVILSSGTDARFRDRVNERAVVLDRSGELCEIDVEQPSDLLIAIIGRSNARSDAINVEMVDLGNPHEHRISVAEVANIRILAHVERRGDVVFNNSEWVGESALQARIEGFLLDWPLCPSDLVVSYRAALADGSLSEWVRLGTFVGSRRKGLGITSICFVLGGTAAAAWQINAEAVFGGATDRVVSAAGRQTVLSGRTGREFLTGFRLSLSPVELAAATQPPMQDAMSGRMPPLVAGTDLRAASLPKHADASSAITPTPLRFERVKMFKSVV